MTRTVMTSLLVLIALLAGTVAMIVAVDRYRSLPQNVSVAPMGEEIQYDDFAFAVMNSRDVSEFEADGAAVRPEGRFVVVTLRVANHAKRVGFTFRPSQIRLVADDGTEYRLSAAGQTVLAASQAVGCVAELPPGTTCTTDLVFDVPRVPGPLRARVGAYNSWLGMLDRVVYGNQLLDLE